MNAKESKLLNEFPSALDDIVNKKYPAAKAKSVLNFWDMSMVTKFEGKGAFRREVRAFIDGFVAGNRELAERLEALRK